MVSEPIDFGSATMAYQRFDGTMSFLPSRFEAQAMLSEMQKKKDADMKLLQLKQTEHQFMLEMSKQLEEQKLRTKAIFDNLVQSQAKMFQSFIQPIRDGESNPSTPAATTTSWKSPKPPDPSDMCRFEQGLTDEIVFDRGNTTTEESYHLLREIDATMVNNVMQYYGYSSAKDQKESLTKSEADPDPLTTITLISSPPPIKPPDPPDYKTNLTSKTSTSKKIPLRYSCKEIYERMENGFCIFCEDLDTPGHYDLKHKRSKLCLVESVGDESPDDEKPCEVTVKKIADKSVDMNREEESNSENESRPKFSHQVLLSQVQHTPTNQYRAPFNPCQNHSDKPHNKSKFGNCIGHEIEFDREGEEIEDDELKDKQPEEDIETLVMSENEKSLECVDDESSVNENLIKVIAEETAAIELVDESGYKVFKERNLNSLLLQEFQILLLHFKESSDTIVPCRNLDTRVLSSHFFAGGITLLSKMVCAFLLPFLTMNIDSRSIFIDDGAVALRRTMEDRFVLRIEEIYLESIEQNLEFAIDRGWVEFWTNTHDFTLTNYGLRLSPSEYTKNIFILVYHHCKHSSSCLFLNTRTGCIGALLMVYDAERLIQSDAPPIFSDLLCVKNRIRGRRKMVLLLEFLWLILFTSKMFKSSNVPQNKNQTEEKLSSYWKLLLSWKISQNIHVSSRCVLRQEESYVKVLELIKDRDSRKRKLCKNWWFKYKLNTWLSEALHHTGFVRIMRMFSPMINDTHWDKETWVKLNPESCKGGSLLEFLKRHEARFDMVKVPNNTKFLNHLKFLVESYILRIEDTLKGCKFVKFTMEQSEKPLITILSYEMFHSPRPPELSCCKEDEQSFVLDLITEQTRDWSFFGLPLQWKWHPPPQATSEFHQAHNAKPVFHL